VATRALTPCCSDSYRNAAQDVFPHQTKDHLTPVLAAKIADLAGVKRLMLTHLYPEVWQFEPAIEAARYFKGEIILAQDELVVFI